MKRLLILVLLSLPAFGQTWERLCPNASNVQCPNSMRFAGWNKATYDSVNMRSVYYFKHFSGGIYSDAMRGFKNGAWEASELWWNGTPGTNDCTNPAPAGANYPTQRHPYRMVGFDPTHGMIYTGPGANAACDQKLLPNDVFATNVNTGAVTKINSGLVTANRTEAGHWFDVNWEYLDGSDKIIAYGGPLGNAKSKITDECTFDGSRNITCTDVNTNSAPGMLAESALVSCGGSIYLYGGQKQSGSASVLETNAGGAYLSNALWKYNTGTQNWDNPVLSGGPPPATWYALMVCDSLRNRLLYYWPAGDGVQQPMAVSNSQVWAFDIATGVWSNLGISGGTAIGVPLISTSYRQNATMTYDIANDALIVTNYQVAATTTPEIWKLAFGGVTPPSNGTGSLKNGAAIKSGASISLK